MAGGVTVRTARLTLRPIAPDDVSELRALWSQPDVRRYLWDDVAPSLEDVRDIVGRSIENWPHGCGLWILEREGTTGPIGFCGFRAAAWEESVELVYGLAPEEWGRGLATEAARAALAHVFDGGILDRVVAAVDVPNERSIRVLRRVGFHRERVGLLDGRDTLFFSLRAADFARRQEGDAMDRIVLVTGNLVEQSVDAIVNAANPALEPGGGVCGAIHYAAGPGLADECRRLAPCPVGSARVTGGHRLRARHVIHAVGPVYRGGADGEADELASAYRESLRLAAEHGLATVAFPAISTGIYGYPRREAADVALRTVREWMEREALPEEVRVVLFTEEDREVWATEWARQRDETPFRVRAETRGDREAVYAVNAAAFDTDGEAHLVDRLRQEEDVVSLVAEGRDGRVVGHVMFSPVSLVGRDGVAWMGLGPVAVHAEQQRRGIGAALIRRGLRECRRRRAAVVVVLGDPAYYGRFGFVSAAPLGIRCEYDVPDGVFQVLELKDGALRGTSGTVRYAEAFASAEENP